MKVKILLSFLVILAITSITFAQVPASQDTIVVPAGDGTLETVINNDIDGNGNRINPNRVYKLLKDELYIQNAAISVINPTGTLTIVGEKGGKKPVVIMQPVNDVTVAQNEVQGSIKFENVYWMAQQTDGTINNELFFMSTANDLPQSATFINSVFEFSNIDILECNGWNKGAKFKISNCYFRNLFYAGQWWGSRVMMCKNPIDTLWVENTTITGGGLTFLNQNALTKFAYFNHNTIVNNKKYWLLAPNYLELYIVNNIFINQNWVGEDFNVTGSGQDPDGEFMSTINVDTITVPVLVQPEYYASADSSSYTDAVGLDKMKIFVSNNINFNDPLLNTYYENTGNAYNTVGPYPISYLNWGGQGTGPWQVENVPGEWMNARTEALFAQYKGMVEQRTITDNPNTVTPGIADATVADQMAKWNSNQWQDPNYPAEANDILHSAYIFGDYDPSTIPGNNTEDGGGIDKFSEFPENFSQTSYTSDIDNMKIGALHWTTDIDSYNSQTALQEVMAAYDAAVNGVERVDELPQSFTLSQNYPNPFNPTTKIEFAIPKSENVTLKVFNILGQQVATLVNQHMDAGTYKVDFDASKLSSGLYIYRIEAGTFNSSRKMMLVK